jgi:HK97 family phage prohead protease
MDQGNIATAPGAELNAAARKYAASQGWALPDGSYPIRPLNMGGEKDLENAIQSAGRGNDPGIKAHIIKRANALGLSAKLPDGWMAAQRAAEENLGMQYRSFTPDLEVRSDGDGRVIRGIAVPYGQVQRINQHLTEEFVRGAFSHQLSAIHRVKLYNGHSNQGGALIGHQIEGRDDAAGFYGEWRVSKIPAGDDTLELVRDGTLGELSIGFRSVADGNRRTADGVIQRTKANLFETAIVPEGAYGDGAVITGLRAAELNFADANTTEPEVRSRLIDARDILSDLNRQREDLRKLF